MRDTALYTGKEQDGRVLQIYHAVTVDLQVKHETTLACRVAANRLCVDSCVPELTTQQSELHAHG